MTETKTYDNLMAGDSKRKVTDEVTILSGTGVLVRGTVLGKVTKAAGTVDTSGLLTGNGAMSGVSLGKNAKIGDYTVTCITEAENGGTFKVVDPDGERLDDAVVGTGYTSNHINFSIADGSADFAAGDAFVIPVEAGSGKCVDVDSTAVDGSNKPFAVLAEAADATSADVDRIAYREGIFNEDALIFGGSDTKETHRGAMEAAGMYLRAPVSK